MNYRSTKTILSALAGLLVALLLFIWLGLPHIIQSQVEKLVAEKTGHRLNLGKLEFNPLELSLRFTGTQFLDPQGESLLTLETVLVDLSATSLPRRAMVFDAIQINGPHISLIELPDEKLNWSPLIAVLNGMQGKPQDSPLPRIAIRSLVVAGGKLDFADRRTSPGFATSVEPIDFALKELTTLSDASGKFKVEAHTAIGAQVSLSGEVALNPLMVEGTLDLHGFDLGKLSHYVRAFVPISTAGIAKVKARYRAGNMGDRLDATVELSEAQLTGLRLQLETAENASVTVDNVTLKNGRLELLKRQLSVGSIVLGDGGLEFPQVGRSVHFGELALSEMQIDLAERQAKLANISLAGGRIDATRQPGGKIYVFEALKALATHDTLWELGGKRKSASPSSPWRFRLDKLDVTETDLVLRDESLSSPAELELNHIRLSAEGISEDLNVPLPVQLAFDIRSGGRFESSGTYAPAGPVFDIKLKLVELGLQLGQPLLAEWTTLTLADGKLSAQGRANFGTGATPSYRGDFSLRGLRLVETGSGETLLAWKTLGSRNLTLTAQQLDLGELRLNGLDTKLIIDKDKNINFLQIIKRSAAAVDSSSAAPALPANLAFAINIDRLRFYNGEMDFADLSLVLPFATRIHGLRGSIGNLSSRPGVSGTPGQLELDGEVDDYGMARAFGQVDMFNPTAFMDLRVVFRNVEMTRLTPYMATFAGRKIDSGKLSLDLEYKIKDRQLQGDNKIIVDRLTLGERVESPTATNLPLDLAIALLQDSAGRIDLGLPISGSLDDPEFSYGQVVWKAITNILTKIVTAPFRAIGALLGGGGEKVETVAFEAGAKQLTPPEREKLVRLAEMLGKRPGLVLAVGCDYTEADRLALQELQLRRAVLVQTGQTVSEKGDPGPISTQQPKIQAALESLFAERNGKDGLAALKEGFRNANPGQLEESATGKVMSRLSGLWREKKSLSQEEVAQLKGMDFYVIVFERLRAMEKINEESLLALAQARGAGAMEILRSAGAPTERLQLLPPQKGESTESEIPLRLSLEVAKAGGKEN